MLQSHRMCSQTELGEMPQVLFGSAKISDAALEQITIRSDDDFHLRTEHHHQLIDQFECEQHELSDEDVHEQQCHQCCNSTMKCTNSTMTMKQTSGAYHGHILTGLRNHVSEIVGVVAADRYRHHLMIDIRQMIRRRGRKTMGTFADTNMMGALRTVHNTIVAAVTSMSTPYSTANTNA